MKNDEQKTLVKCQICKRTEWNELTGQLIENHEYATIAHAKCIEEYVDKILIKALKEIALEENKEK